MSLSLLFHALQLLIIVLSELLPTVAPPLQVLLEMLVVDLVDEELDTQPLTDTLEQLYHRGTVATAPVVILHIDLTQLYVLIVAAVRGHQRAAGEAQQRVETPLTTLESSIVVDVAMSAFPERLQIRKDSLLVTRAVEDLDVARVGVTKGNGHRSCGVAKRQKVSIGCEASKIPTLCCDFAQMDRDALLGFFEAVEEVWPGTYHAIMSRILFGNQRVTRSMRLPPMDSLTVDGLEVYRRAVTIFLSVVDPTTGQFGA